MRYFFTMKVTSLLTNPSPQKDFDNPPSIHQRIGNVVTAIMIVILVGMVGLHTRQLKTLEAQVRVLSENNVQLIGVNEVLSKGVSNVAESMIQKATWDKQVAGKIQELDALVKGVYGRTNQAIPEAVR